MTFDQHLKMRIGNGYDVHALVEGRKLILGGVDIEWHKGLDGHSDADVLIHAVCDALLGAAGLGDIGRHFPPDDPAYSGVDSRKLLVQVSAMLKSSGWKVSNVDCIIIAEKPKLASYVSSMIVNLAQDMNIETGAVNVKATTTEKLGFIGREEGIAAQAVALIITG
jgi:2-C-methyl-D-erythritol 2,4-cyclodiphosphate synthase